MALSLMYITNNPQVALIAENTGVDRIWIDLETLGKEEGQKNMNTVKSHQGCPPFCIFAFIYLYLTKQSFGIGLLLITTEQIFVSFPANCYIRTAFSNHYHRRARYPVIVGSHRIVISACGQNSQNISSNRTGQ